MQYSYIASKLTTTTVGDNLWKSIQFKVDANFDLMQYSPSLFFDAHGHILNIKFYTLSMLDSLNSYEKMCKLLTLYI